MKLLCIHALYSALHSCPMRAQEKQILRAAMHTPGSLVLTYGIRGAQRNSPCNSLVRSPASQLG